MKQELTYNRKYYFDYDIFSKIDNAEKAYWIGFLYADGYILSEKGGFGCGLNQKDREHLIKFVNFLGVNTLDCIKNDNINNSCKVMLHDINLYEDLVKLGFNSNKSYDKTSIVFDNIPNELKKFFILGFWDGDGYVSITGEGKNQTGCISNNESLIDAFVSYVNSILGKDFCKKNFYDYPRIRIYTNKAKTFLDWLYSDTPTFLERKHEIYLNFKEPDEKYNRPYQNIRRLPSGNYFVQKFFKKQKYKIGTFSSIKEAVEDYNKKAIEVGFEPQEYIGEFLTWEEAT